MLGDEAKKNPVETGWNVGGRGMALGHRATSPQRAGLIARLGRERPLQAACLRSRQSRVTPHYLPRQCRLRVPGNMATLFKSVALVPAASIINGHVGYWGAAALHTTRAPWRSLAAKAGVGSRRCWGMRRRRTPLKRGGMSGKGDGVGAPSNQPSKGWPNSPPGAGKAAGSGLSLLAPVRRDWVAEKRILRLLDHGGMAGFSPERGRTYCAE